MPRNKKTKFFTDTPTESSSDTPAETAAPVSYSSYSIVDNAPIPSVRRPGRSKYPWSALKVSEAGIGPCLEVVGKTTRWMGGRAYAAGRRLGAKFVCRALPDKDGFPVVGVWRVA